MLHDSRLPAFRRPAGAVPVGSEVYLALEAPEAERCTLRLRRDGGEERRLGMERGGDVWSVTLRVPETPGLLWYDFEAECSGRIVYCGNGRERLGGRSECTDAEPVPYQLTVYVPGETPAWFREGIVYQIFPDRFARGADWRENWRKKCALPLRGGAKYVLSEDWEDVPFYTRRTDRSVSRWQFFGGTLEGIREKLGYLRELGVTVLYLNPIFLSASSHRYDTADYLRVDPLLGDEADFARLASEAGAMGIRILLDGVFNHTGRDSVYFNRFGTFPEPGAWQGETSPYRDWFTFRNGTDEYECWWGVLDLPDVREEHPAYRELICGENGVIRKYLRLGASGWRLDVADELPDDFIREIRAAALAEKADAMILGEVWEDASNKISYNERRTYLLGEGLHGVMNYPFRECLTEFLLGGLSAPCFCGRMDSLLENYPPQAFAGSLNLIGSHDRARILTVLGEGACPEEEKEEYRLPPDRLEKAKRRLELAWAVQMAMPGAPCLYYGDEAGMQGFDDPWNRGTFPWGKEDGELTRRFRALARLRGETPAFLRGDVKLSAAGEDVLRVTRSLNGESVTMTVDRAENTWHVESNLTGENDRA